MRFIALKLVGFIVLSTVSAQKACTKNVNLWKSIQYQLKLAEKTDGWCNCGTTEMHGNKRVGFLARFSKNQRNVHNGATLVFDKVVTNTGSGYDASTGQFVAPYEGLYYFSWTVLTGTSTYFISDIFHNGNKIASNFSDGTGISTGHISASQSVLLQLTAKDRVYIKTQRTGQFRYGEAWTTFSGFKI
ncbi:complement C1q-like protein 4 [Mytilus trossulus]|uniref:complement C1q-like protein 4 n=1 Tax=Mytilus trossulus TaxID=6551 RepID=UPI0030054D27